MFDHYFKISQPSYIMPHLQPEWHLLWRIFLFAIPICISVEPFTNRINIMNILSHIFGVLNNCLHEKNIYFFFLFCLMTYTQFICISLPWYTFIACNSTRTDADKRETWKKLRLKLQQFAIDYYTVLIF